MAEPRPSIVVVDCDPIAETDTSGSGVLDHLHGALANIRLVLARANHDVPENPERDGALKDLAGHAVYPTVREAAETAPSALIAPAPDGNWSSLRRRSIAMPLRGVSAFAEEAS